METLCYTYGGFGATGLKVYMKQMAGGLVSLVGMVIQIAWRVRVLRMQR